MIIIFFNLVFIFMNKIIIVLMNTLIASKMISRAGSTGDLGNLREKSVKRFNIFSFRR